MVLSLSLYCMKGLMVGVWRRGFEVEPPSLVEVRHLDETRIDITELICRGDSASLQGSIETTPFLELSKMVCFG